MNPEFWHTRWQNDQIGFHQSEVEPLLIEHFAALNLAVGSRVLVPLCGKSIDMEWLAAQGYEVVGIELSELAVQAFFTERDIVPEFTEYKDAKHQDIKHGYNPTIKCYQGKLLGQTITIWAADIFTLTSENIGHVDAVYDKAALIALPANTRPHYTAQVRRLSTITNENKVNGSVNRYAPQLLLTFDYDQSKRDKPPFSVSSEQIEQYYSHHYQITELAVAPATLRSAPDLTVTEHVWLLR